MSATRPVALAVLLALVLLVLAPPPAAAGVYAWPVDGEPVVAFHRPGSPYGAGHRGVDLPVSAGAAVRAMAAGEVSFAGSVAGTTWVTVRHPDGVRTTVGPLIDVVVVLRAVVGAGQVLGHATGDAHGTSGRLHVGARRGSEYVDPAGLVTDRVPTLVGPGHVTAAADTAIVVGPLVPGTPPSPGRLVVVGGLGSSTDRPPFDPRALGYGPHDAEHFSYAGMDGDTPRDHDPRDTWGGVHDAALLLREQLRAAQRREPGRPVDLVAHSLGGLVSMYYLLVLHDPTDPTLPAIDHVVTLASPLTGADLATAHAAASTDPVLDALLELADAVVAPLERDAPVLDDLRPGSPVVAAVADAWERARDDVFAGPLATGTDLLAVGALLDPVVPAWRTDLEGMDTHTAMETHGGVPRDRVTQDVVEAFLADRPLPHGDRLDVVAGHLRPATVLVSLAELLIAS